MNQLLIVSPCPNCGTDASKSNKVLYDGIFLICNNCGYGWYYNVEFINLSNQASYNSKSKPLNTLRNKHINSNRTRSPSYTSKAKKSNKSNTVNNKDTQFHKANYAPKKTIPKKKEQIPQPISYNTGQYTNNVYFSPVEHNNTKNTYDNTKNENNYITPTSNNNNSLKPTFSSTNKGYKSNVNNVNKSSQKEASSPDSNLSINSVKSNINTNIPASKNIYKKSTVINVNNSQNHTLSNNSKLNNNLVTKVTRTTSNYNNNAVKKVSTVSNLYNSSDLNKNLSNNKLTTQNKNSLSFKHTEKDKVNSPKNKVETNNSLNIYNNKAQNKYPTNPNLKDVYKKPFEDLNFSNKTSELEEDFNQSISTFTDSIKNKKQLGLDTNTMLQIEKKSQYSTKYNQSKPIKLSDLVPDFKKICNSIKKGFSIFLRSLILIFTRLDLLLRFIAYIIIIVVAIGLLVYLNYKKHNKISQSYIFNSPYNSKIDSLASNNVKFDKNSNPIGILVDKILNSIQPDSSQTIITSNQSHTLDFENKSSYKENLTSIPTNSEHPFAKSNIYSQTSNSFKAKIISSLNKSVLAFKQAHKNTFSKLKVFQNSINWKGDHNNTLVSRSTIFNSDSNNSYLIKKLEVIFLGPKGNTVGKRTIIANQLINNYSAIELNLQLNNPPSGTKNVFVSIKDKYKL